MVALPGLELVLLLDFRAGLKLPGLELVLLLDFLAGMKLPLLARGPVACMWMDRRWESSRFPT